MKIADFYQAQAASHGGITKADVVVENVALQGQCRWSEYLEVVEDLEADAFFLFALLRVSNDQSAEANVPL